MMIKILLAIEVLLLLCSSAFADDAALSTDQQKSSYAIGLQMVLNLRRQEITIESKTLVYEVALLSIGKTAAEQRSESRPTAIQSWKGKRVKATSAR